MNEVKHAYIQGLVGGFGLGWSICCFVWAVVLIASRGGI